MPSRVRLAVEGDIPGIQEFLKVQRMGTSCPSAWSPAIDLTAIELDIAGEVTGIIAARPVMLVHEFQLSAEGQDGRRESAQRLLDYGVGLLRGLKHHEAFINVRGDNLRMQGFLRNQQAELFRPEHKFYRHFIR